MLQRVQSLYLLVAVVCGFIALLNPFAVFSSGDQAPMFLRPFSHDLPTNDAFMGTWPVGVLWLLSMAVLGAAIFQYKNRVLQARLAFVFTLVLAVIGVLEFYLVFDASALLGESYTATYALSIVLPFLAAVFSFLARQRIRKDEELLKSVDRLR